MDKKFQVSTCPQRRGFTLVEILVVISILAILAALVLAGVSFSRQMSAQAARVNWHNNRRLDPSIGVEGVKTVRIFFVGNSLTDVNDLPRMLQALAEADGSDTTIEYDTQILGGSTLEQQWGASTTLPKLHEKEWDFVVLQEQGQRPFASPQAMYTYAKKFDAEITGQHGITLLYLTFARQYELAYQSKINNAYFETAKKLNAEVAPVGPAWQRAMQQLPQLQLYSSDQIHPLPAGSYLAACVFYSTIFGKSPVGLPGRLAEKNGQDLVRLDDQTAQALQTIAWQITKDSRPKWAPDWRRTSLAKPDLPQWETTRLTALANSKHRLPDDLLFQARATRTPALLRAVGAFELGDGGGMEGRQDWLREGGQRIAGFEKRPG